LELLSLSLELDYNQRLFAWATLDLEGPEFDVLLDSLVRELATNQTFSVEDSVGWISSSLIFGSITDETFLLSKSYV